MADRLPQKDTSNLQGIIKDLQDRIYALERATGLRSASIGQGGIRVYGGGNVTVEDGGAVRVFAENGNQIFYAGDIADGLSFVVWNTDGQPTFTNDRSGYGINKPYFNIPVYPFRDADGNEFRSNTASGSFQTIWRNYVSVWHRRISFSAIVNHNGGGSQCQWEVDIVDPSGSPVIDSRTFGPLNTNQQISGTLAIPDTIPLGNLVLLRFRARVTAPATRAGAVPDQIVAHGTG